MITCILKYKLMRPIWILYYINVLVFIQLLDYMILYNILKEVKLRNIIIYLKQCFGHRPSSAYDKNVMTKCYDYWMNI